MRNIHTEKHSGILLTHSPALQQDVVRFKITIDLAHDDLNTHPSLLPQLSELLLASTKQHSRDELLAIFQQHGADVIISHDDISLLTINVTVLDSEFKTVLNVIASILSQSTFNTKEITRVKKQIAQELIEEVDDADMRAYTRFTELVFGKNSPNTIPSIQKRRADLETTSAKHIRELYQLLQSRVWLVSIIGNKATKKMLTEALTHIHKDGETYENTATCSLAKSATEYISVPSKSNVEFAIGNCLPVTKDTPEYTAFMFGLAVLAKLGGFSGRLMSTVREKEGLTYMIYGKTRGITMHKCGAWYIDTFFAPKDVKRGLASTKRELKRIVTHGITSAELARFKTLLNNQYLIVHESDTRTLNHYHGVLIAGQTAQEERMSQDDLLSLSRAEVNAALRKYLKPNQLVVVSAGSIDSQQTG